MSNLKGRNLISITDFTKEEYIQVLDIAEEFEKNPKQQILSDKVVATLFFEPSTRTRLSFESAANMLGARIIGFSDPGATSVQKGESLHDTITMVASYADLIVMRNPKEGSSRYASEVSNVPVINAGDGANQHPTQCMLDLYSIRKTQGTLDNLNIAMVGALKYGRAQPGAGHVQLQCHLPSRLSPGTQAAQQREGRHQEGWTEVLPIHRNQGHRAFRRHNIYDPRAA